VDTHRNILKRGKFDKEFGTGKFSGLYYKHITIVSDDSRVISMASPSEDSSGVISTPRVINYTTREHL